MRTFPLTILGFLLVAVPAAATDGYEIIGSTTSQTANRLRTEMTVRVGDNPLDQFKMIRLARRIPTEDLKGSILLLPPLGWSFTIFEQRDEEMHPTGLTPIPLFPPVLTNHQALVAAVCIPDPTQPITMIVPTYVLLEGSLAEDRLFNASEARTLEATTRLYDYYPFVVMRDVTCSIAGLDDQHIANLADFTGPVLAIGAGRGYGPYMQDQLDLFGSGDTVLLLEPEFGHLDHFLTEQHRRYVERPIRDWLQRVLP